MLCSVVYIGSDRMVLRMQKTFKDFYKARRTAAVCSEAVLRRPRQESGQRQHILHDGDPFEEEDLD